MISRRMLNTLIWTFSAALLALPGGATSAQQKMNSLDMGRARQMLRDARDAVRKNYYDPNTTASTWMHAISNSTHEFKRRRVSTKGSAWSPPFFRG